MSTGKVGASPTSIEPVDEVTVGNHASGYNIFMLEEAGKNEEEDRAQQWH